MPALQASAATAEYSRIRLWAQNRYNLRSRRPAAKTIRGGLVEAYILTAICVGVFIATVVVSRFLIRDWETYGFIGLVIGLLLSVASAFGYLASLMHCTTCR